MGNKKTLDIIKDLKKNIIFSTCPPKDNEGENQSFWYDSSNNKLYAKANNKWELISGEASVGGGSGDMLKSVYDINNNNIVDNAEKLNGKLESQLNVDKVDGYDASAFALVNHTHSGMGDMLKSVYDTDNDGIVDNAELIEGRKIYVMNRPPQSGEGNNGDIWIEY